MLFSIRNLSRLCPSKTLIFGHRHWQQAKTLRSITTRPLIEQRKQAIGSKNHINHVTTVRKLNEDGLKSFSMIIENQLQKSLTPDENKLIFKAYSKFLLLFLKFPSPTLHIKISIKLYFCLIFFIIFILCFLLETSPKI